MDRRIDVHDVIGDQTQPQLFFQMLYLIGLGLADEQDITLRGLNAIKRCTRVYLESYTSILHISKERLESFYAKSIILADREMVESQDDDILHNAQTEDIAFLVVGDPFG
jgi:diphthine synthase